jgi:tRNA (guanine-N7-)-methyltransferase
MTRERKGRVQTGDVPILQAPGDYSDTLWPQWFPHPRPVEIDWGCGKGRFLLAHAAAHPERDFLGVDLQLRRLGKLNQRARDRGIGNIRLVCADIRLTADQVVPPHAVDVCYLFFPDPWPKRKHHPRRLVNPAFLDTLHRLLKPAGIVHLATDHADYFTQMVKVADGDPRFERVPPFLPSPEEQTDFEIIFVRQAESVHRLSLKKRHPAIDKPAVFLTQCGA